MLGVTADGERDILGLWAGEQVEAGNEHMLAETSSRRLAEIRRRSTGDLCAAVRL
jgi:transposase-like protein